MHERFEGPTPFFDYLTAMQSFKKFSESFGRMFHVRNDIRSVISRYLVPYQAPYGTVYSHFNFFFKIPILSGKKYQL